MQATTFAALSSLAASIFWTETDPFVGKWKLDVSRSTIVDSMRVQTVGPNKYSFNFEGAPTETIVADGTDQPGLHGTTLAVRSRDPHSLLVVRKQEGQVIVSASWELAADGRTLHDAFTSLQPDGSKVAVEYLYKRVSGTSGLAGTWESTTKPKGLTWELEIQPFESKGLRFLSPGSDKTVTFDGRPHSYPGVDEGMTLSGRRVSAQKMRFNESSGGRVEKTRLFELSRDRRSFRETVHVVGQTIPDVLVFERE